MQEPKTTGTVMSRFGIRPFYTVQSPQASKDDRPPSSKKKPADADRVKSEETQQPSKDNKDVGTSTTPAPKLVPGQPIPTQTDQESTVKKTKSPQNAQVDVQTSPVQWPLPDTPFMASPRQAFSAARSYGNRTVITEDYYNALSRHPSDGDRFSPMRTSMSEEGLPLTPPPTVYRSPSVRGNPRSAGVQTLHAPIPQHATKSTQLRSQPEVQYVMVRHYAII